MSNGPIRPSTLDGIKRFAKTLKASQGLKHADALDAAAVAGGYQNYAHARHQLDAGQPPPRHIAYITVSWSVCETKERGQETLAIRLAMPLDQLVKPAHLKSARHFGVFRFAAADHLTHDSLASSQCDARHRICAAARTLVFMEATGLRPSSGNSRAYPRGDFNNSLASKDHYSEWYDPAAKAYVFVDEPYSRAVESIAEERLAWGRRHGWAIVKSAWAGMYNPSGGCDLYLAADLAKGYSLDPILKALADLPPPFVDEDWNGQSDPYLPPFTSSAALAKAEASRPERKVRAKTAPGKTVAYRPPLSRSARRRPATRMPIEAHEEVGALLKTVISAFYDRRGVYNRLNSVRCDLDDWLQAEYNRAELSDERFFDAYYHEDLGSDVPVTTASRDGHLAKIERAKAILTVRYADSAPLRGLLKTLDLAIASLQAWSPPKALVKAA